MSQKHTILTEDQIVLLVSKHLPTIQKIEPVEQGFSTTVWKITSDTKITYLRVLTEISESVIPEQIALTSAIYKKCKVPELIIADESKRTIPYSYILITEIKGIAISNDLKSDLLNSILFEVGKDLAKINTIPTHLFGYRDKHATKLNNTITGKYQTARNLVDDLLKNGIQPYLDQKYISQDLATNIINYLNNNFERCISNKSYLHHGDFDLVHIFHNNEQYTGIIDFGDVRSDDIAYDLAHFAIYNSNLFQPLFDGWYSQYCLETNNPLPQQIIKEKIEYQKLCIALGKGAWVIKHSLAGDPYIKVLNQVR